MEVHGGLAQLPPGLAAALGSGVPLQGPDGDAFVDRLEPDIENFNTLVKLLIRHFTPAKHFGQPVYVTVGSTPVQVLPFDLDRFGGIISIPQGVDVWMGGDNSVKVNNGLRLEASVAPIVLILEPEDTQAFYMISAGVNITVTALVKRA